MNGVGTVPRNEEGGKKGGTVPGGTRSRRRESPLSYKRWDIDTYVSFHALRTYILIQCIKNNYPDELIVSRRIMLTRLKKLGYESDYIKLAFREFMRRYSEAIIESKGKWMNINCKKIAELENRLYKHLFKHNDIVVYLTYLDEKIKELFEWN